MGKCRTCKYWFRGIVLEHSQDSVNFDGTPHIKAGTIEHQREWENLGYDKGRCTHPNVGGGSRIVTIKPESNSLITRFDFGCSLFEKDSGSDKYEHIYIEHRGQQSLEDHIKAQKEQPEFEKLIGVVWDINKEVGVVQFPEPETARRLEKRPVKSKGRKSRTRRSK